MLQTETLSEVQWKVRVQKLKHMFIFKMWPFVAFFILIFLLIEDTLSMIK